MAAAIALLVLGAALFYAVRMAQRRAEIAALTERTRRLRTEVAELNGRHAASARQLQTSRETLAQVSRTNLETDSPVERVGAAWLARAARMKELAAARADLGIDECAMLTDEQWFAAAREAKLDSDDQVRDTFKSLHDTARESLARQLLQAVRRYADEHEGQLPATLAPLASLFGRPLPPALLDRFEVLQRGALDATAKDEWILAERTEFARERDNRIYITPAESGTEDLNQISERELRLALQSYVVANEGRLPAEPAQLVAYFRNEPRPAAVNEFLAQPKTEFSVEKLRRLLPPR